LLLLQRSSSLALVAGSALALALGCSNDPDKPSNTGGTSGSGTGGASGSGTGGASAGSPSTGGSAGTTAGSAGAPAGGTAGGGTTGGAAGTSTGGMGTSGAGAAGGSAGMNASGEAGMPIWGVETRPTGQTCVPPMTQKTQPTMLSATGCVDPADPKQPAATMIPYGVITPLWSDGAAKGRYFALPDGGVIHVKDCTDSAAPDCQDPQSGGGTYEDEGDWSFPVGTVFMKTFGFESRLVETRLLIKKSEFDWWGYSYHWNAEQTDAALWDDNIDGYDEMVQGPDGMVNWHYPSRAQCLQCHVTAAGVSLGPETSQLNYDFEYPNGVVGNQLETLEHIGIFEQAPPMRPAYPSPADTSVALDERARSYLHINCGICHRPGGNFTDFDARFATPLADMLLCGEPAGKAVPEEYMLTDPLRLDPGHPESSVVSLRMHSLEPTFRMPQIGSRVVDATGTKAVDDWITSLTACP
jgi:uncharacterized repeat protein (TIGR03806 family)